MNKHNKPSIKAFGGWPAVAEPPSKWRERRNSAQDTSAAETTEVDEMSSEPFHINDHESLTDVFEHDQFPIQGGLEKLDIMDTGTATEEETEEEGHQQHPRIIASVNPCSADYEEIECLMYGMNRLTINHKAALELAQKNSHDPVMIAVQALLHRDDATANQLWKRANQLGISSKVERGCGLVQALVGKMLEDGVGGVVKDSLRASFWYTQAAKKGHACAQCFLGLFHVKSCEYDKARHWLGLAARQGHARAQMHYGLLFEHGRVDRHGRRDFEQAKEWYRLASAQGDTKAACRLGYIVRRSNHQEGHFDVGFLSSDELMDTTEIGDDKDLTVDASTDPTQSKFEPISFQAPMFAYPQESMYGSDGMLPPDHHDVARETKFITFEKEPENMLHQEENEDVIAVKSLWQEQAGSSKKRRLDIMTDASTTKTEASKQNSYSESLSLLKASENPFLKPASFKDLDVMDVQDDLEKKGPLDDSAINNSRLYDRIEALLYGLNKNKNQSTNRLGNCKTVPRGSCHDMHPGTSAPR